MARRTRSLAAAALTASLVAAGAVIGLAPAAHAAASDNAGFLAHLNGLRAAHGLPALQVSGDLTSIATAHSQQMAGKQTIFHNPSLTSQVSNWQVLGENVGMGGSVASIDTAFDHSPEHYANEVSSSYTQVGIGTAWDNRGYLYVTLDFRKPMHAVTTAAPKPAPAKPVAKPAAAPVRSIVAPRTAQRSVPAAAAPAAARAAVPAARTAGGAAHRTAAARPVPAGSDPVAYALAFSRTLAGLS